MKFGGLCLESHVWSFKFNKEAKKKNPKYQKHNYEIHVREHGLEESIDFLKNDLVSDAHM